MQNQRDAPGADQNPRVHVGTMGSLLMGRMLVTSFMLNLHDSPSCVSLESSGFMTLSRVSTCHDVQIPFLCDEGGENGSFFPSGSTYKQKQ